MKDLKKFQRCLSNIFNMMSKFTVIVFALTLMPALLWANTGVQYLDYQYQGDVVQYPQRDTFVICDDCIRMPLVAYKEPEKPRVLISLQFNPEKPVQAQKQAEQTKATESVKKHECEGPVIVYFPFDRYTLTEDQKEKLLRIADNLKGSAVTVHGYACTIGSAHYNLVLSAKRAQTVADYLTEKGIKVQKIQGHGETAESPIKALNRKVEIKIENKKGGDGK